MSLPVHFPELKAIPAELKLALASEIIALGFVLVENSDLKAEKEFKLVGSTLLLKSIADTFEIDLLDELKFFTQTGKAGDGAAGNAQPALWPDRRGNRPDGAPGRRHAGRLYGVSPAGRHSAQRLPRKPAHGDRLEPAGARPLQQPRPTQHASSRAGAAPPERGGGPAPVSDR